MDPFEHGILAESSALGRTLIDLLVLVGSIAALYGIVRCLASSRRPDRNAKAAWALAAVFAAVAIPGLAFLIGRPLGALVGERLAVGLLYLNAAILMLGLLLTSLILSTVAWAQSRRFAEGTPIVGRRHAIGAFAASLTLATIVLGAREFVTGVLPRDANEDRDRPTLVARASLPAPISRLPATPAIPNGPGPTVVAKTAAPPVVAEKTSRAEKPSQTETPPHADKPAHTEKQSYTEKQSHTERLAYAEKPVQTEKPPHTKEPSETEKPSPSAAIVSAAPSHGRSIPTPAKETAAQRPASASDATLQRMLTAEDPFDPASPPRRPTASADSRIAMPPRVYPPADDSPAASKSDGSGSLWNIAQTLLGLDPKQAALNAKLPKAIETLKIDRLNFQFRPPDTRWVATDPRRFNRDASAAYVRSGPDIVFMIIAERLGVERNLTTDGLLELNRASTQSATPGMREIEKQPQTLHGMSGVRVAQEATLGGTSFHYERWLCVRNGFSYQLLVFGRTSDRRSVVDQADKAFDGFDQLDPFLVCHSERIVPLKEFAVVHDGFNLKLADRGWQAWSQLATAFPSAEFGAVRGETALAVVPIDFDDFKPARDARLSAFLVMCGCAIPRRRWRSVRRSRSIDSPQFSAHSIALEPWAGARCTTAWASCKPTSSIIAFRSGLRSRLSKPRAPCTTCSRE